jgi:hypothetical protein
MSHSDQAITNREVANVFLKHEAEYDRADVTLPEQLVRDIADDLLALHDLIKVYNAVYMLDEKPFAFLPHHEANQIQYFMRRFRNSGGWKLISPSIYPWRQTAQLP